MRVPPERNNCCEMEVKQWHGSDADANPLGLRHRLYGFEVPAVDVDFLLCEYSNNLPKALIEYKHRSAASERCKWNGNQVPRILFKSAIATLRMLAERACLPFYVAFYDEDWTYEVYQLHDAERYCVHRHDFTETEYVEFLYKLRGMKMPEELHGKLNS
jgi:hypothetical protein